MTNVYIVGVGMTPLGKHLDKSVADLAAVAMDAAFLDAGCRPDDLDAAWFANTRLGIFEGQHGIRGQVSLRPYGLRDIPIFNTDNACASSTAGIHLAAAWIQAGFGEVALVVGAEKMNYPDKKDLMFSAFKGGTDQAHFQEHFAKLTSLAEGIEIPDEAKAAESKPHSLFMDSYAAAARIHMQKYGSTQRQLAAVSAKNHHNATMNPLAHYRKDMSVEEVLADQLIVWPLTRSMCAPMTDGAGAIILCHKDALSRFERKRAVRIRAAQITTGSGRGLKDLERMPGRLAARRAYEQAAIDPKDISVAEVHDASSYGEVKQVENMMLCEEGKGGWMAESGESALGGRCPVNPSGGLISKGHPIAATGAIQIHELVTQLRGEAGKRQVEGARFGAAENGGGFYDGEEAIAAVTILERP